MLSFTTDGGDQRRIFRVFGARNEQEAVRAIGRALEQLSITGAHVVRVPHDAPARDGAKVLYLSMDDFRR